MKEWISLNMTPQIGPRAATKLLERFGSAENVFHATRSELESLRLRRRINRKHFKDANFTKKPDEEFENVKELGGDVLILDDGSYPYLLREIADPPITLYVKGDWQACFEAPCIAVVGSRRCSTYGENASEMLSRDLAANGICIVSGWRAELIRRRIAARLPRKGRTIAVLGTGIDSVYPKENARLVDEILDVGRRDRFAVSARNSAAQGKLSVSKSNHKRTEFGSFDCRSVGTKRFFDNGAAGDGTKPRSFGCAGKHYVEKFFRHELFDKVGRETSFSSGRMSSRNCRRKSQPRFCRRRSMGKTNEETKQSKPCLLI